MELNQYLIKLDPKDMNAIAQSAKFDPCIPIYCFISVLESHQTPFTFKDFILDLGECFCNGMWSPMMVSA